MPEWLPDFRNRIEKLVRFIAPYLANDRREDVVQDASRRYIEAIPRLRKPESHLSFLNAIARNTLKEHLREHRGITDRYQNLDGGNDLIDPPDEQESIETHLSTQERGRNVMVAVQALPPRLRETVLLRIVEERTVREVAELQGCSPGTVCANLTKAWLMLHDPLERGYLIGDIKASENSSVSGATARISRGIPIKANGKGEFLLLFLKPGRSSLCVEAEGFDSRRLEVTIAVGRNEVGTIVLEPTAAAGPEQRKVDSVEP